LLQIQYQEHPYHSFFQGGKIADKQVGAVPKKNFVVKLDALIEIITLYNLAVR